MSATNADAYHFALHFRVPDDQPVHGDPGELTIAELAVGHRLALRLEGDGTAGQAKQLMLLGQGYDAEEQAREVGKRARNALLLATLESHVGVEWATTTRAACLYGGGLGYASWPASSLPLR